MNETDFVWSKYKTADIVEMQKMIEKEVKELQDQQNIMMKKSDKGHQDDMQDIIRYMPEKQLKEQKLKIHVDIFKKLHEKLTLGDEGNILNQIKV